MAENTPQSGLTGQQKTGFVLLLIFGVLAIGLGFLQMRNNIFSPFIVRNETEEPTLLLDETTRLQRIDTDQDGLNDYEELNFYQTSPYLPDTDSDGIGDKTEIDRGADPLCPEGKDCSLGTDIVAPEADIASPLVEETVTPEDILGDDEGIAAVGAEVIDIETFMQDPAALRELLLATGSITQEQLDAIDDDELLQVVEALLAESDSTTQ
jgi:hypothetical protein